MSPDLVLSRAAVAARGWGGHQEQSVDQNAPEADRRNVPDVSATLKWIRSRL